jgi:hypothetical protein
MRQLVEAMLAAARRKPLQVEATDVAALLDEAAATALVGKSGVVPVIVAAGERQLARREALLLVAGLARRLVQSRTAGELRLQAQGDRFVLGVSPAADADTQHAAVARADSGTGSALLDRLAARLGWQVVFDAPMQVSILFSSAPETSS